MTTSLLILRNVTIEHANAIAGLTYGFPAISNFLGFTHALCRKLKIKNEKLILDGCAVVVHQHQVHAHPSNDWNDYVFSLTRNPLSVKGKSPSFIEEGKMHLTISLVIECDFDLDDLNKPLDAFEVDIKQLALTQHLAGGLITGIKKVEFFEIPEEQEKRDREIRKKLYSLLPGFLLVERRDLLAEHIKQLQAENSSADIMDAWLDFAAIKYQAKPKIEEGEQPGEHTKADWEYYPKPDVGWLVPITTGYRAISNLYSSGKVDNTRDRETPFRFVEAVYTIGQWISPHRIKNLEHLFWRYEAHPEEGWYLCRNHYQI